MTLTWIKTRIYIEKIMKMNDLRSIIRIKLIIYTFDKLNYIKMTRIQCNENLHRTKNE